MIPDLACLLVSQTPSMEPLTFLRRDVTRASTHVYWMSYQMRMDVAGAPGVETLNDTPIGLTATYKEQITPLKNGKARISVTFTDMKMNLPGMAGAQSMPKAPQTQSMIIDARNNSTPDGKSKGQSVTPFADMFGQGKSPIGTPLPFPERPIAYGDSWKGGFGGTMFGGVANISATFLGEENVDAVPCWRIMTAMDMDLGKMIGSVLPSGEVPGMEKAPVGFMTLTGYSLLNKKDGAAQYVYINGIGKFEMAAQGESAKMKMGISIEVKRLS